MVNFVDQGIKANINDKAFEKPGFQRGNVQWKKINNPQDVHNITADYLIICSEVFYPSGGQPNAEILRFCDHRQNYNSFDFLILNVNDIISANFDYEGYPDTTYRKEQKIRKCIKTIYETGTANHTYDGKLGYVLLIWDVDGGPGGNSGMPTSFDHPDGVTKECIGKEPNQECWYGSASDYYFSCINKKPDGTYDKCADLYIGRFCVPNNLNMADIPGTRAGLLRLKNMVTKTIDYETDFKPKEMYKQQILIAMGAGTILQIVIIPIGLII
jgi:hypothetical protein